MTFQPEAVRAFEHAGWQRAAARYNDTFAHATAPFVAPLLDAAGVSADKRVLDVACGPGHVAAAAVARGAVAQGLDFSAAMADLARTIHPDITVTEGDAEDMPHAEGAFDAVVSNFGIHHVPRPEAALAECRRVLAPDGRVASRSGPRPLTTLPGRSCSTRSHATAIAPPRMRRRREAH